MDVDIDTLDTEENLQTTWSRLSGVVGDYVQQRTLNRPAKKLEQQALYALVLGDTKTFTI